MSRKHIRVDGVPAVGPYSHAIDADPFVFLSGQTPLDPNTGKLVRGPTLAQAKQTLANMAVTLAAAGMNETHAIKCTIYLTEMADLDEFNTAYTSFFSSPYPARTIVAVSALPSGACMEIDMVALRS